MTNEQIIWLLIKFIGDGVLSFIATHFLRSVAENINKGLVGAKWYREIVLPHLPVLIAVLIAWSVGERGKSLYLFAIAGYFSANLYRAARGFGVDFKAAISKLIAERLK